MSVMASHAGSGRTGLYPGRDRLSDNLSIDLNNDLNNDLINGIIDGINNTRIDMSDNDLS